MIPTISPEIIGNVIGGGILFTFASVVCTAMGGYTLFAIRSAIDMQMEIHPENFGTDDLLLKLFFLKHPWEI